MPAEAFEHFAALAGVTAADLIGERAARSPATTRQAEALAAGLDPKARERVSRYIERGSIGDAVKARHGGRCQICAALGADGIAFHKADGSAYAEAHHVMPVAMLIAGSLGAENIMVLCPNHHRQAHFGRFAVVTNAADHWILAIDDRKLRIEKTRL
ncbi:hypothetical protein EIK56_27195 [Sphingomonas sp. C8-2]|nr:hypothetical protein EIK56_27195 [Sphingomonas sp. C8-2]